MSNNIRKSSLEQAKTDFEEIRKFAQSQAEKKLEEEVDKKLLRIMNEKLNEDVNISVDEEGNIAVTKDGEEVATTSTSDIEGSEDSQGLGSEEDFIEVSDDEEPISVSAEDEIQNENMTEMDNIKMEQDAPVPAPAATAPAAPAPDVTAAPAPELAPEGGEEGTDSAVEQLVSKMDTLINLMMQQQGVSGEQGKEQEFEVIDDEAAGAPATAPAPAPTAEAPAPVAEDMEFEIEDFEDQNDTVLEIVDDIEGSEEIEIVDEDEMPEDGASMEETRGLGFTSKRTGDKALKMDVMAQHKGHHAPVTALEENKKAQYESTIGELKKENKGLNTELKDLRLERKEFEDAFVQLREQFDEMQTFNGKLALVNKLLMNGGLSFEQKLKVCEQFDGTETIEEAQKLYKSIIKENNIKVGDATSKIKASTTHTAKSSMTSTEAKPLYESDEARRMKQLAGLSKNTEN
jgi:hypothetical protein